MDDLLELERSEQEGAADARLFYAATIPEGGLFATAASPHQQQPHQQQQQQQQHQQQQQQQLQDYATEVTVPLESSHAAEHNEFEQELDQQLHDDQIQEENYHSLSWAFQTYLQHDLEEKNHWEDVCRSFQQYAAFAMEQWANQQYRLHALPETHRAVLPDGLRRETHAFSQRAAQYKEAAIRNQFCLDCILRHSGQPLSASTQAQQQLQSQKYATDAQMSKVSSVLKSLMRDWSREGKGERDMAYQPILRNIQRYVPLRRFTTRVPRVCVPGAGVARLACEISSLGYTVQGNEFSLYMLLASDFILNGPIKPSAPLKISPFLLESRNVHSCKEAFRTITIPDVDPYNMIISEDEHCPPDFSMAAGEFVSIYGNPREYGQWDAVVASFFLDASPCIVEYLHVIHNMLAPGGILINFGPLLWHWSGPAMRPDDRTFEDYKERYSYLDPKYLQSIDLSWDDLRDIITNIGFEMIEYATGVRALYTADIRSMMNMEYRCVSFVARKKKTPIPTNVTVPKQSHSRISYDGEDGQSSLRSDET